MSPALLLFVCTLAVLCAQEPAQTPAPRFRVGAELVVVDLVATDRDGRFVADLQPGEIQVFEDGKPQKVEFVRLVRGGREAGEDSSVPRSTSAAPDAPPGTTAAPGIAVPDPVRLTIVIDLLTTPAGDLPRVQDAIVRMVSGAPQGTEMMLASLWQGVTIHQPFTADKNAFTAAVKALPLPNEGRVSFVQMLDAAQQQCETGFPPLPQLIAMGQAFIAESRMQLTATSTALAALTRAAAAAPGRKHVVLYSRGYAFNAVSYVIELIATAAASCGGDASAFRRQAAEQLAAHEGFDAGPKIQALVDSANRSQVSFYAIDPRGLAVTGAQAKDYVPARSTRGGLASRATALEATLPQEYLRTVAGDTGGRAFLNTNDLTAGLRRAWVDANEYYLIGYAPPSGRKKGRFHKIEVKVERRDVDLRFRKGYSELADSDVREADLERALGAPGAYEGAGLDAEAAIERGKLKIVTFVRPSVISFSAKDGLNVAELRVHAVLRDGKGKLVGGKALFGRDIALRLKPDQLQQLLASDDVEIPVEVGAPPKGPYRLTVVAQDRGGWIGARTIELHVP